MKRIYKIVIFLIVLAVIVPTIIFLKKGTEKTIDIYEVKSPVVKLIENKAMATGSVVPRKEIQIKPQVSGIVQEIYLEAGAKIKAGQPIAKVKIIPDVQNLNSAESQVNRAKLSLDNEEINYNRQKKLFEKKVISESDFQAAELAYKRALEDYSSAQSNLEIIKDGVSKKANSATNTIIRSTIDGVVLDISVKEGNSVIQSNNFNDGTTIAYVADMNDMIFEGNIDETEVGKIKEGMKLELHIGAIDGVVFDAVLEHISPKGTFQNGTVKFLIKARIKLRNDIFVRSGYSANANIILERNQNALVIDEGMITYENGKAYVDVLVSDSLEIPQRFEHREVSIGICDGINVEITNGLTLNDKVKGLKK